MMSKRNLGFVFFVMIFSLLFLMACGGTTSAEQTTLATSHTTTGNVTTVNNTISTTPLTTEENTTGNMTITTEPVNTEAPTTEYVATEYQDIDALYLSVNRLENAQFDIDFSQIFEDVENNSSSFNAFISNFSRSLPATASIIRPEEQLSINTGDYTTHPYWTDTFYHNDLFVMPTLDDGFYLFTGGLETYNDTALNNLYECAEGATSQAQDIADWAIDHITVMDTWVVSENDKYLLNYDNVNDVVTVYYVWHIEFSETYIVDSYRKVSVYYNDNGEEVIENWIYEITSGSESRNVNVYYNSIGARDFNYYFDELDEFGNAISHHYRGINRNADGRYEYYDNSLSMISGDHGWYQIYPTFDLPNQQLLETTNPMFDVYNSEGTSNVFQIYNIGSDTYRIKVFLPSMSGIEAVLAEEASLLVTNVDSEMTQQFLIDQGITPMPDIYLFDNDPSYCTGFRTSAGDFLSTDEAYNGTVDLINADINVMGEGAREYQHYKNFFVNLNFNVTGSSVEEAVSQLMGYLNHAGVTYEFGDLDSILNESYEYYNQYNDIIKGITFVNDLFGIDYYPYADYQNYVDLIGFIHHYINNLDEELALLDSKETVNISEIPTEIGLDSIAFINLDSLVSSTASVSTNGIDFSNINIVLNQSPIFENEAEYNIYYSLAVGDKVYVIDSSTGVTYNRQSMTLVGDLSSFDTYSIPQGEYILTMFIGKSTGAGTIRVSNVVAVPVDAFDPFTAYVDEVTGGYYNYNVADSDGAAYLQKIFIDTQAPAIMMDGLEEPVMGEYTIPLPVLFTYGSTIRDIWNLFQVVTDNVDGPMYGFDYTNVSLESGVISSDEDLLGAGTYTVTFSDSSGNETIITMTIAMLYEVSFYDNYGYFIGTQSVPYGESATAPTVAEMYGYTPTWSVDFSNVTSILEVHLTYVANTHTITYMVDGEVYQVIENAEYDSLITPIADPVNEGYTFSGWENVPVVMPDNDIIINGYFIPNE